MYNWHKRLKPGDVLLYSGHSVFSWLIKIKTWSKYSHTELYLGDGFSAASRDGTGVKTYPLRLKGLAMVLRPRPLDMAAVWAFHRNCVGQHYDWWGLLRFFTIGVQSQQKQFCSEYVTRLLRHGGCEPFHPETDADSVSPGMLATSAKLTTVWSVE